MKNLRAIQRMACFVAAALIMGFGPMFFGPGMTTPEPFAQFAGGTFPGVGAVRDPYRPAYPNVFFDSPITFTLVPGQNKIVIGQLDGKLFYIEDDPEVANKHAIVDFSEEVGDYTNDEVWDGGFLGLSIHPDFGAPGKNYFYIYYTTAEPNNTLGSAQDFFCGNETFAGNYLLLERFEVDPEDLTYIDGSKVTMIKRRMYNTTHRGGGMDFGEDGFLYLSTGDQATFVNAQEIDENLDGGVLRIDVDKDPAKSQAPVRTLSSPGAGEADEFSGVEYWIPNDNPFLSPAGANFEEYYSIGHRNPHRMTRDANTGVFYIGEVGEALHEEINVLSKGKNYGWPLFEGLDPGPDEDCVTQLYNGMAHEGPLTQFPRAEANALIGGFVYRGTEIPSLEGRYICADYGTGDEIWSVDITTGQYEVLGNFTPQGVIGFGQDFDKELYILKLGDNVNLYKLAAPGINYGDMPQTLSATGAFTDLQNLKVSTGYIPYELIDPFWSDGALKKRWMAIPNDGSHDTPGERIKFSENGEWEFPLGTVMIKHFDYPVDDRDATKTRKVETRFSVKADDGNFYFLTYKWNEAQTEAYLQETGVEEPIQVTTVGGGTRQVNWHFPSNSECLSCHNAASKGTLGPRTRNLNSDYDYSTHVSGGTVGNQLVTLSSLGILDRTVTDGQTGGFLTHVSIDDPNGSLDEKARSYLDLNCAYCHRPGTGNRADFDLRLFNTLSQTGLTTAKYNTAIGIPGEEVLIPGDASRSQVYHRVASKDPSIMMPPLAKGQVDAKGAALIEAWIDQLLPLPPVPATGPYRIVNRASGATLQVPDAGLLDMTNVAEGEYTGSDNQHFVLENANAGYYQLRASHSDKYLDVASASTKSGANIWQYEGNGTDAQLWEILDGGDGTFYLVSKLSGYYLGTQPDGNVVVKADNGSDIFRWEFLSNSEIKPLVLSPVSDRSDLLGSTVDFTVVASGGDPSAALGYSLSGAPEGVSVDASTGRVSGTLTGAPGSYAVTVGASRPGSAAVSTSFSWRVSEASRVVYRINAAGGPLASTDGGPDWSGDGVAGASAFGGHSVSSGGLSTSTAMSYGGRDGSIPGYIDAATYVSLFSSERWDQKGGAEMSYSIPLPPGDYVVNVYMGNSFSETDGAGDRVFDVTVEGSVAHGGVDLVSLFGHLSGGMLSYPVHVADGALEVGFVHGVENPLVNAIEVLAGAVAPGPLVLSPVSDRSDLLGSTVDFTVVASGGDPSAALGYSLSGAPEGVSVDASTGRVSGTLTGAPGSYAVTVGASRPGSAAVSTSFSWRVSEASRVVYRINAAGGPLASTDGGPDWSGDGVAGASAFGGHSVSSGGLSTSTAMSYGGRDGSIPGYIDAATYVSLFSSERWDQKGGAEMSYSIPLPPGDYVVNVYMGNSFSETDGAGDRVFDVTVEGSVAHGGVDLVSLFGHLSGGMLSYPVHVADGALEVGFVHGVENPLVNAIEVLAGAVAPGPLVLSPVSDRSDLLGATVDFTVVASGGDPSAALGYSLSGAPEGVSVDASTGRVSGTLTGAPGSYAVTVGASRPGSAAVSTSFSWRVSEASRVVYRINAAGGPLASTDGGPDWSGDGVAGASAFGGHSVSSGGLSTSTAMSYAGRDGSIPGYIDAATYVSLFSSERWDQKGGAEMSYSIPLPPGDYVVNVYMGNSFSETDGAGDRVFDVTVEGSVAHGGVDLVSLFGHLSGGMLSYPVHVADGALEVGFVHGVENPLVNAIEVLAGAVAPGPLVLSPVSDRSDLLGSTVDFTVVASGGDPSAALGYSLSGAPEGVSVDASTGRVSGTLTGAPGSYAVTVGASRPGSAAVSTSFSWRVSEASRVVYRINAAGGPLASTDGGPDWSGDGVAGASAFGGHSVSSGGLSTSTAMSYGGRDGSIPGYIDAATYVSLFSSERWDQKGGAEMSYSIPLPPGDYVVNVYMGNSFSETDGAGDRVFDVTVEGSVAHGGVDLVSLFGHLSGGMLSYPVHVADGALEVGFVHGVENPLVNAIEVLAGANTLNVVSLKSQIALNETKVNAVTIAPNPVIRSQNIQVSIEAKEDYMGSVSIFTLNGGAVFNKKYEILYGQNVFEISTDNWETGIYLIKVSVSNENIFKKIIIKN
ncbi:malectin domain-containing carbohydrate-binding protein [Maribacter sp. X9]|uniref:malectin domain-containing carbohydrate-binding protein n=1 Tax=Maribacter sp. X9 TaxID=3402159 RepID=UPI003AF3A314